MSVEIQWSHPETAAPRPAVAPRSLVPSLAGEVDTDQVPDLADLLNPDACAWCGDPLDNGRRLSGARVTAMFHQQCRDLANRKRNAVRRGKRPTPELALRLARTAAARDYRQLVRAHTADAPFFGGDGEQLDAAGRVWRRLDVPDDGVEDVVTGECLSLDAVTWPTRKVTAYDAGGVLVPPPTDHDMEVSLCT